MGRYIVNTITYIVSYDIVIVTYVYQRSILLTYIDYIRMWISSYTQSFIYI